MFTEILEQFHMAMWLYGVCLANIIVIMIFQIFQEFSYMEDKPINLQITTNLQDRPLYKQTFYQIVVKFLKV